MRFMVVGIDDSAGHRITARIALRPRELERSFDWKPAITARTYANVFDDELDNIAAALDSLDDLDRDA
jgi:hypothetical protein